MGVDLSKAANLAGLHDQIRRDVTAHLRWALDMLRANQDHLPKSPTLAEAFYKADFACTMSEKLTAFAGPSQEFSRGR